MKSFIVCMICLWIGGFLFGDLYGKHKSKDKIAMLENNLKACNQLLGESK